MAGKHKTAPQRCPDCGAVGMDNCERATCSWNQWDDGTRVTEKQRADGAKFAHSLNALLAKRHAKEGRPPWWQPMSEAPRDGTCIIARRAPEDSERDFAGVETWWGKTSHVPLFGWCHMTNPDDPESEDVDIWWPDEWRYMVEEVG